MTAAEQQGYEASRRAKYVRNPFLPNCACGQHREFNLGAVRAASEVRGCSTCRGEGGRNGAACSECGRVTR